MGKIYTVLVTTLLLFPWSIAGMMVLGAIWDRGRIVVGLDS